MTHIGTSCRNRNKRSAADQRGLMRAYTTVSVAIQNVLDEGGVVPCVARPSMYQDPAARPTTAQGRAAWAAREQRCAQWCAQCPVLEQCLVYADLARAQGMANGAFFPSAATLPTGAGRVMA